MYVKKVASFQVSICQSYWSLERLGFTVQRVGVYGLEMAQIVGGRSRVGTGWVEERCRHPGQ